METSLSFALAQDGQDPLRKFRNSFYLPHQGEKSLLYFCGNSLGLQPIEMGKAMEQELEDWRHWGVEGFTRAQTPWLSYEKFIQEALAPIIGAYPEEIAVMNSLTVNLHLLMSSFYSPKKGRYRILMEAGAFPSDQYAVETQVKLQGFDPVDTSVEVAPGEGSWTLRKEDILEAIQRQGNHLALVLLGGVQYFSGQVLDLKEITHVAHQAGAMVGFDLAHGVGNIPLNLHDWGVDFAVWCSYKYLNGGPGAVGGAFIHERYARDQQFLRMAGWWGTSLDSRFRMGKRFVPQPGAGGWQVSTAQILNMVGLRCSLKLFNQTSITEIRKKSIRLTGYLEYLLHQVKHLNFEIITPADRDERGAQLSLFFREGGKGIFERLKEEGMIVDWREPGVIRVAPAPLYNSFEEVHQFYEVIKRLA
ncbi:MAG: kynureninase [Chitinophagaceae bacterium]